ncbi:MAG: hypothetical protein WAL90_14525 [Desulfobacterales bacterium]
MDMTGWLEYFVEGLTTQLAKVRERGELAIRRDVLVKEHRLSDRQAKALAHILEHGSLTIQDFEGLCPDINRRSLQRDLKAMVDGGLIVTEGETHQLLYRFAEETNFCDRFATKFTTPLRHALRTPNSAGSRTKLVQRNL